MVSKKEFRGILEPLISIRGAVKIELFEDYKHQVTLNFKNINSFVNSFYSFLNGRYKDLDNELIQIKVNKNEICIFTYVEFEDGGVSTGDILEIHISGFEFDNLIEF